MAVAEVASKAPWLPPSQSSRRQMSTRATIVAVTLRADIIGIIQAENLVGSRGGWLTASGHRGRPRGARTPDRSTLVRGAAISSVWDWRVASGAQSPPSVPVTHRRFLDAPAVPFS